MTATIINTKDHSGKDFLAWLKSSLLDGNPPLKKNKALVYTVPEGIFLVSPDIFKCYNHDNWHDVQQKFQRLRIHRLNLNGIGIHTYLINGKKKKPDQLNGYLITYTNMFGIEQLESDRCLKAS